MSSLLKFGLVLYLGIAVSCAKLDCNETHANQNALPKTGITSERAIFVPYELLGSDYELDKYKVSAVAIDDVWKVTFRLDVTSETQSGPVAFISRSAGKIIFVAHSK